VHRKVLPQNSCNVMCPADMFCFRYITVDTLHVIHNMVQCNVACRYVLNESPDTHWTGGWMDRGTGLGIWGLGGGVADYVASARYRTTIAWSSSLICDLLWTCNI
jgi:hypothetical protein